MSGQEPSFQGQPRASQDCLSNLESLSNLSEKRRLKHSKCLICQEDFPVQLKDPLLRLPCHHIYHKQCITQWLNRSATCPCCRYELLTDNEEYNTGVRERMSQRQIGEDTDREEEMTSTKRKSNELHVQGSTSKRMKMESQGNRPEEDTECTTSNRRMTRSQSRKK